MPKRGCGIILDALIYLFKSAKRKYSVFSFLNIVLKSHHLLVKTCVNFCLNNFVKNGQSVKNKTAFNKVSVTQFLQKMFVVMLPEI